MMPLWLWLWLIDDLAVLIPAQVSNERHQIALYTGHGEIAPQVTAGRRPGQRPAAAATLDVLTAREREVLTLVARGWSNAEIAERLYLSPATAKTHVGRLLTKLQARDRTQLVVIAYETGLVTPSGP